MGVGLEGDNGSTKTRGGDGDARRCVRAPVGFLKVGFQSMVSIAAMCGEQLRRGNAQARGSQTPPTPRAQDQAVPVLLANCFTGR